MGFRFFKRIKIAPGISLNLSKSGGSFSFGPKGAKLTIGPKGVRKTVGIPGTGIYHTETTKKRKAEKNISPATSTSVLIKLIIIMLAVGLIIYLFT